MENKNVLVLHHFETPQKSGEHHRLLCLTGSLKGKSFYLIDDRVVIGRSKDVDISLQDIKASREHVEIVKVAGGLILSDLNSQNGVWINDLKVKQHRLQSGDKVVIGQTVMKYSRVQVAEKELDTTQVNSIGIKTEDKKKKPSPIILLTLVIALGFFFFDSGDTKKVKKKGSKLQDASLSLKDQTSKNKNLDKEVTNKLNDLFNRGLRELREKNYLRAINEFNLALFIEPNNSEALFYKRRSEDALNREIEINFVKGRRDFDSLKYKGAIIGYCSIVRLLHTNEQDQRYKDAAKKIKEIEEILGYDEDHIKCIEK